MLTLLKLLFECSNLEIYWLIKLESTCPRVCHNGVWGTVGKP